jgi:hypothetical protein
MVGEDVPNMSVRKLLVSVATQPEIEGVRAAVVDERLKDGEALPATVGPTVGEIDFSVEVDGASAAGAIARREAGETFQDIARSYNASHPTIMRLFPSPFEQSEAGAAG